MFEKAVNRWNIKKPLPPSISSGMTPWGSALRLWSHTNSSPQGPMWKQNSCPSFSAVFSGDRLCLDLPNRKSEGIFKQQKQTNEYWVNRPPQQFLFQPHTATHRDNYSCVLFCFYSRLSRPVNRPWQPWVWLHVFKKKRLSVLMLWWNAMSSVSVVQGSRLWCV